MTIAAEERELVIRRLQEAAADGGTLRRGHAQLVADQCGVHLSTIYRWIKQPPERMRPRYKLTDRDKVAFFEACGNASLAFRELSKTGPAPPSLSTYRRALEREFDYATTQAAKYGAAARAQARIALRDRKYARNERWEADHTMLEIEVIPPRATKPVRPWLTWVIDSGTRFVGGWAVSLRPTRAEVLAVLRLAIEVSPERGPMHGRPGMLVWDNGLEFTANAVNDCALMIGSFAAPAFPYTPEQKPKIERINHTLERDLLARLPYYTGGPRARNGTLYGPPGGRLTLAQFVDELAGWIDAYNMERPHSGLGGLTPREAWEGDPTPLHDIPAADLRRFTLERRLVTVKHDAGITIDRRSFVAPQLNAHVKRRVEAGLLPHDYSRVEVFDRGGKWICTAKPVESLSPADIAAHRETKKKLNAESARLLAKRTRLLREKWAPMTAEEPEPRILPPDPALQVPVGRPHDALGFGVEIGEVE